MNTLYRAIQHRIPARQHGAALIIGLVLLISLTVVGVGVLSTTSLEQRMAGNMTDLNLAFNAAETAGRAFAARVRTGNFTDPINVCQGLSGCYGNIGVLNKNWWDSADSSWWDSNALALDSLINDPVKGVKTQPKLVVETIKHRTYSAVRGFRPNTEGVHYLSITSRGTGASDKTEVIIQQVIVKR